MIISVSILFNDSREFKIVLGVKKITREMCCGFSLLYMYILYILFSSFPSATFMVIFVF
jgi:hypothetical protein